MALVGSGQLYIRVVRAYDMVDSKYPFDSFVVIRLEDSRKKLQTPLFKCSRTPEWHSEFVAFLSDLRTKVHLKLYKQKIIVKKNIGVTSFNVRDIAANELTSMVLSLNTAGCIQVILHFLPLSTNIVPFAYKMPTLRLVVSGDRFFSNAPLYGILYYARHNTNKVSEISLSITGKSKFVYHTHSGAGRYQSHVEKAVFLDKKILFFDYSLSGSKLEPGLYAFPFLYVLPKSTPPSFSDSDISIEYEISATVSKHNEKSLKHRPTVFVEYDALNASCMLEPKFKKGKLTAALSQPPKLFVGERNPVTLSIENHNEKPVRKLTLKLSYKICAYLNQSCYGFSKNTPMRTIRKEVWREKRIVNILPQTSLCVTFEIFIPLDSPPSAFRESSSLIDLKYFLNFRCKAYKKKKFKKVNVIVSARSTYPSFVYAADSLNPDIQPMRLSNDLIGAYTIYRYPTSRPLSVVSYEDLPDAIAKDSMTFPR
ncbi:uncharacterized protein LOC126329984 [Schistocerca gregaria]|uniref:uncharacterized protein LOC126329984 n=1 Tax=Schistocerca gregaria TaxID=7010 RepID=UPI00211E4518|nr:uncharacterized protein LOC126329984 [Schistocerca gregaria]